MQPKFTLKNGMFITALMILAFSFLGSAINPVNAQTTITTTGTNYAGTNGLNDAAFATFAVQNTNTYDIVVTGVSSYLAAGSSATYSLWRSTTLLSGPTGTIGSPDWTSVATGTTVSASAAGIASVLSSISVIVPAGATHRFALVSDNGISYSGNSTTIPTPNTHSGGGVNLLVGNATINSSNVGYAGYFPAATSPFTPRFFTGAITFVQSTPCTGTPAPGNTVSSVTSACAGSPFNLSLQNSSSATGLTYQWQSSADGTTWANITGANSSTLTRNHTAATYYRCQVTCSGNTGSSTALLVGLTPPSGCYCAAGATSTSFEKISRVEFGTINNASTSTVGYENFLTVSTNVIAGQTLPARVTLSGSFSSDQVLIWIDFNQNGSFSDAGELVYTSANGVGPHLGNVTIPSTALLGSTRMRVRLHDTSLGANATPCGNSSYGQVEDYTVVVEPCVQGAFTTNPASASITCGGNATFTAAASGSAISYTWQYRTSATGIWQEINNGGIVSGATTATLTLTDVPATYNGYEIRCIIRGACTGANPSSAATLTVNPIAATTNVSGAIICSGGSQMLTLTNTVAAPRVVSFSATSGLPLTVPDANLTGVTSSIAVSGIPAGSVIKNVAIKFSMTHTWVGDLIMNLKAPNGQTLNLVGRLNGGTGSNGTENFTNTVIDSLSTTALSGAAAPRTGTFRADKLTFNPNVPTIQPNTTSSWLPLFGGTPNGNWTIAMCDVGAGDVGILTAWSIEITYVAPVFAQGTWTASPATPNTIFTDAALTVPYTGGLATTVYVNPTVNTNYTVSFTTATTPCTSAPRTIPVSVGVPIAGLTAPATVATCVGSGFTVAATHTAVPATNAAPTYQWQVSADGGVNWSNISGATGTTLAVASTTQSMNGYRYRIAITSGSCAPNYSTPTVLTVNALPTVTLSAASTTLTPGKTTTVTGASSPAATTWAWTLNGAALAGATNNQVANIDGLGAYQATVRDVNGCVNSSNKLTLTAEASDKLWIYPNPTSGAFQIRYYHAGDANEKRIISVYNAAGQLVASKSFDLSYTSAPYLRMDVDLSGAARGTYVVKVAHEYSGKIVSGLVLVQ